MIELRKLVCQQQESLFNLRHAHCTPFWLHLCICHLRGKKCVTTVGFAIVCDYVEMSTSAISDSLLSMGTRLDIQNTSLYSILNLCWTCCAKYAEHFKGGNKYPIPPCMFVSNTNTTQRAVQENRDESRPKFSLFVFSLFARDLLGCLIIIASNSSHCIYPRLRRYHRPECHDTSGYFLRAQALKFKIA